VKCYLVRHGETDSNTKKIYAGQKAEGLTENGRRQARMMAGQLLHLWVDEIYCSPVARAVETAAIIGAGLDKRPVCREAFREIAMGPWEGKSETEVQQSFPAEWQIWNTRPAELTMEGRETLGMVLQRALMGLETIRAENDHGSILIVSHVAVIRVLTLFWQGLDLNLYRTLHIPHGKVFTSAGFRELPA
jgi:broad specificity phosphatase PhoE